MGVETRYLDLLIFLPALNIMIHPIIVPIHMLEHMAITLDHSMILLLFFLRAMSHF